LSPRVLVLCLAALPVAAGAGNADGLRPARDALLGEAALDPLEGDWEVVSFLAGGESSSPAGCRVSCRRGRMTFRWPGGTGDVFDYRLRRAPGASGPLELVVPQGSGGEEGAAYPGIYRSEGALLVVCFRLGDGRPQEFASPKGGLFVLITLRRLGR
jgi:uncharacterized protein (TIGR03067 family)